jgi:hypothetical protein
MKTPLEVPIECLEEPSCPTATTASDTMICPKCGRPSLEYRVSYEDEAGYICRCGFGCRAEEIDEIKR